MAAKKRSPKNLSPLDARRRALEEKQEAVRRQQERAQRLIARAPQIREQNEQRRREELRTQAAWERPDFNERKIADTRFNANVGSARRGTLKAEKRHLRLKFFGLFCGFALLALWVYSIWKW